MERLLQLLDECEDLAVWLALRGPRLRGLLLAMLVGAAPAALWIRPALWPIVVTVLLLAAAAAGQRRLETISGDVARP